VATKKDSHKNLSSSSRTSRFGLKIFSENSKICGFSKVFLITIPPPFRTFLKYLSEARVEVAFSCTHGKPPIAMHGHNLVSQIGVGIILEKKSIRSIV